MMYEELRATLHSESAEDIDWITFVGSGEPTLNRDLGTMIKVVKTITSLPVAVITNGSLLSLSEVREDLSAADAVLPTLDAGSAALFRRINRPHPDFDFERHVEGLVAFGSEFTGRLWLEVMLIAGINDDEASLENMSEVIKRIGPDEIHLVLPTRPPAEPWVHPSDEEGIARALTILGSSATVLHPSKGCGGFSAEGENDPLLAAACILRRHPMTDGELRNLLAYRGVTNLDSVLQNLRDSGKIIEIVHNGKISWRAS